MAHTPFEKVWDRHAVRRLPTDAMTRAVITDDDLDGIIAAITERPRHIVREVPQPVESGYGCGV